MLLAVIYLSFISLGLPDGLLGAAWPTAYGELSVPVSAMGIVAFMISAGTVVSSLQSDRLTRKYGTGLVTAVSVCMTAAAIMGFAFSRSFILLCLWAIPYGLGAGSVDAALNNYVALHYKSRHMSWLHCMWGLGASTGPLVMGAALARTGNWHRGYLIVGILQILLTAILFASLPHWKKRTGPAEATGDKPLSLKELLRIPGVMAVILTFFCYCAIEQTAGQWAASYLTLHRGMDTTDAARFASMFYIGITVGRGICGFITFKLNDEQMIHMGFALILAGVAMLLQPFFDLAIPGLIIVGLGCAPIYPSLIHATPAHFGRDRSQAVIGVQMAGAYVGTTLIPPLFGAVAGRLGLGILPVCLLLLLVLMAWQNHRLERMTGR